MLYFSLANITFFLFIIQIFAFEVLTDKLNSNIHYSNSTLDNVNSDPFQNTSNSILYELANKIEGNKSELGSEGSILAHTITNTLPRILKHSSQNTAKSTSNISYFGKNAVSVSEPYQPIYYLQTNEGVIQHLRQIGILSMIGYAVNRSVVVLPFMSPHYPDISFINICKIFKMEANVKCSNESLSSIFSRMKCYFTGIHYQPSFVNHTQFTLPIDTNPDFKTIPCVAGYINREIGIYPRVNRINSTTGKNITTHHHHIQTKYKKHLPLIVSIFERAHLSTTLNQSNKYVVIHWRRGDQLTTRCKETYKYHDKSVNCGQLEQFFVSVNETLSSFIPIQNQWKYSKYIATNEKNQTIIDELKSLGYSMYSDIEPILKKLVPNLTSLDAFIYELILMCDADYFISWGESSISRYVRACRARCGKLKGFIHDGKAG